MADLNTIDIDLLEDIKGKVILDSGLSISKNWTQKDFDFLVYFIEKNTGTRISLSTLKRVFNNEYTRLPHIATLDALSTIAYKKSWHELKKERVEKKISKAPLTITSSKKGIFKKKIVLLLTPLLLLALYFTWQILEESSRFKNEVVVNGYVNFKSDKSISQGVPNTIMFNYDINNISADSFFIQQSWNRDNKVVLDSSGFLSSIYYYPGFHRAKLIANDSVIMKNPVHITTSNWLPLIRYNYNDNIPIYVAKNNRPSGNILSVSKEDLARNNVDEQKDFLLTYYNVRDFGKLDSDNFTLKTRFRNDSIANYVCPKFELMIMCEVDIYRIRLTSNGCVNLAKVKMGEVIKEGANYDLAGFGTDLYNWQDLELTIKNKVARIYLNEELIFETSYKSNFGKIMGLSYTYTGLGSIDFVELISINDSTVFMYPI